MWCIRKVSDWKVDIISEELGHSQSIVGLFSSGIGIVSTSRAHSRWPLAWADFPMMGSQMDISDDLTPPEPHLLDRSDKKMGQITSIHNFRIDKTQVKSTDASTLYIHACRSLDPDDSDQDSDDTSRLGHPESFFFFFPPEVMDVES
jgi:hypothetical protein